MRFNITDTETIKNETNGHKPEENDTSVYRMINVQDDTNADIETIIDDVNSSNYHDAAREADIDSEDKCNDKDRNQDEKPRRKNAGAGVERT